VVKSTCLSTLITMLALNVILQPAALIRAQHIRCHSGYSLSRCLNYYNRQQTPESSAVLQAKGSHTIIILQVNLSLGHQVRKTLLIHDKTFPSFSCVCYALLFERITM
jgi:hypothetical protein